MFIVRFQVITLDIFKRERKSLFLNINIHKTLDMTAGNICNVVCKAPGSIITKWSIER